MDLIYQTLFLTAIIMAAYLIWVRPILRLRPSTKWFYDWMNVSVWGACRAKLVGLKGRLVAGLGMAASVVIGMHDYFLPLIIQVDWSPILSKVPGWVIPIATFAAFSLIKRAREVTEARHNAELARAAEAAAATPTPAPDPTEGG